MKYLVLAIAITSIFFGCQNSNKPKYKPTTYELNKLFELIEVSENKISFYLTPESVELLLKMEVYPFEREGRKYLLRVNKKLDNTQEVPLPFELIRLVNNPRLDDVRVVGYAYTLKKDTKCDSEDCRIEPKDIEKIYYQLDEGSPEVLHQANVKLVASNNVWIRSRSTFYRHNGENFVNELDEYKSERIDCQQKFPFGRARTTWIQTNQFFDTYTHIKCDD
jgi:hypothetical protein